MGSVACYMVLHCLLTGKWLVAACPTFLTPCALVWPSFTWPSRTLSNRWRHERLRTPEKAATAILRDTTKIITDTNPAARGAV